jgi:peptidoglycan/LPS O-acetylase OafA/YrhL|tara:strand:+ start:1892 stop:2290 length:399 start_codon:yes stop_codon:yes gene_type:complete
MKFLAKLILLTVVLALITFGFLYFTEQKEQGWFWGALGFYLVAGLVIGLRTQKAVTSDSNSQFFMGVMGSIGIRMLLCIVFLAIYLMVSDLKAKEFVVYYLILYLFYTIFEISQLVSKLRPEKSSILDDTTS